MSESRVQLQIVKYISSRIIMKHLGDKGVGQHSLLKPQIQVGKLPTTYVSFQSL